MDHDNLLDDHSPIIDELTFRQPVRDYLKESAGWSKFLGIVGFIFLGLSVLSIIFLAINMASLSSLGGGGIGGAFILLYVVFTAIFAIPVYHLYNFATKTQEALQRENQSLLVGAFSSHKTVFKFYGIVMIIVLALYAIVIMMTILGI